MSIDVASSKRTIGICSVILAISLIFASGHFYLLRYRRRTLSILISDVLFASAVVLKVGGEAYGYVLMGEELQILETAPNERYALSKLLTESYLKVSSFALIHKHHPFLQAIYVVYISWVISATYSDNVAGKR